METGNSPYKKLTWTNFMMLHWIINPGLFISELILGQRVPKEMWIEKNSSKPLFEKTWIPCPHCHTLHDGRTWSGRNGTAFKNWFGLYCPACGGIIPCLTNGVSAIILGISYPIRILFWDRWKQNWLQKQPARYLNIRLENQANPYEGAGWIRQGLSFGFFMYLMMELIIPLITAEKITLHRLVTGVPVWVISGLLFGYTMKLFMGGKGKTKVKSTN